MTDIDAACGRNWDGVGEQRGPHAYHFPRLTPFSPPLRALSSSTVVSARLELRQSGKPGSVMTVSVRRTRVRARAEAQRERERSASARQSETYMTQDAGRKTQGHRRKSQEREHEHKQDHDHAGGPCASSARVRRVNNNIRVTLHLP